MVTPCKTLNLGGSTFYSEFDICERPRPQPTNFFLKLGLTRFNGWDRDAQNVEFTVKCTLP